MILNPIHILRDRARRRRELEETIAAQIANLPAHYMPGIGPGEFMSVGQELVELLRREAGLRRRDIVLDIGCGLGRVAIPLQRILTKGTYEGFDVVPEIIEWDQANISRHSPRFRFQLIDAASSSYNPQGADPSSATFPYPDRTFTLTMATSLFSHLMASATNRYLEESARVLKPGGRAIFTFFLLDDFARRRARLDSVHSAPRMPIDDKETP